MALIIETGSIVAGANSLATAAELRTYAGLRGVTLSEVDAELEPFLIEAMDCMESKRGSYQGTKTSPIQELQFPRTGMVVDGSTIGPNEIPREAKYAQLALAMERSQGRDLMPTQMPSDKGAVVKERVEGVVERQYSDNPHGRQRVPAFAKAEALMAPLYRRNGLYSVPITRG